MKYFRKEDIFTFLIKRKTLNKQFLINDNTKHCLIYNGTNLSNGGEQTYE